MGLYCPGAGGGVLGMGGEILFVAALFLGGLVLLTRGLRLRDVAESSEQPTRTVELPGDAQFELRLSGTPPVVTEPGGVPGLKVGDAVYQFQDRDCRAMAADELAALIRRASSQSSLLPSQSPQSPGDGSKKKPRTLRVATAPEHGVLAQASYDAKNRGLRMRIGGLIMLNMAIWFSVGIGRGTVQAFLIIFGSLGSIFSGCIAMFWRSQVAAAAPVAEPAAAAAAEAEAIPAPAPVVPSGRYGGGGGGSGGAVLTREVELGTLGAASTGGGGAYERKTPEGHAEGLAVQPVPSGGEGGDGAAAAAATTTTTTTTNMTTTTTTNNNKHYNNNGSNNSNNSGAQSPQAAVISAATMLSSTTTFTAPSGVLGGSDSLRSEAKYLWPSTVTTDGEVTVVLTSGPDGLTLPPGASIEVKLSLPSTSAQNAKIHQWEGMRRRRKGHPV